MKSIGIIGCGAWGKNILRDLLQLDCNVYVADINEQARLRASSMGADEVFSTYDALPLCDGYVVAVPIPDLTTICAALLQYKKPVFSEKTLCLSMKDYNCLKSLGGHKYIFAMHKWHYHAGIEALRQIAISDDLGAIEEIVTTRHGWVSDFHGGDVFWTQAVHDITIIKHILGYVPQKINAINVIQNKEGLPVSLTAMLGDKPVVVLSVNGRHCDKISGVSIHGVKGSAELNNALDDHITLINEQGEHIIPLDTTMPLFLELKEFVAYLHGGPKPRCDLNDAKEVMEILLRLRKHALK